MKQEELRAHFDWVAAHDTKARRRQRSFHDGLTRWYVSRVPLGSTVLEWGCGKGGLLAQLAPSKGQGADFSPAMVAQAEEANHAGCQFVVADITTSQIGGIYDYVVLDYLIGYLPDVQCAFSRLQNQAHARTRLMITTLNSLWKPMLAVAGRLGWVMRQPESNWLSRGDVVNLLELSGWEIVETSCEQLPPFRIPILSAFLNRVLVRIPGFAHLGVTVCLVARPVRPPANAHTCSVIVPLRNEAGNIAAALSRIPILGARTEIIFVEGHSRDDTWEVLQREVAAYKGPHHIQYLQQPGRGKWDAVRAGFAVATGDVLVIQDGDLTAPPEDLGKFFEAIASGRTEFANGSRLVYPMEKEAMRLLNFFGNKFFALALSYVLGQSIKDSLCGTKALLRSDYERLLKRIEVLGDFDPFGDFNLLFGASMLKLRIRDIPVRYKDRTYGETNISRFRHGWLLLRMTWFGLCKLKWR